MKSFQSSGFLVVSAILSVRGSEREAGWGGGRNLAGRGCKSHLLQRTEEGGDAAPGGQLETGERAGSLP